MFNKFIKNIVFKIKFFFAKTQMSADFNYDNPTVVYFKVVDGVTYILNIN